METPAPPVSSALIHRLRRAVTRYLPQAIAGDAPATHQARVASRRLREAVPVLTSGVEGCKAGSVKRKIRRLTRTLGTVRESDVSLGLADELARADELPRTAVEDLRAHILGARTKSREEMVARLERLDAAKLNRQLLALAEAVGHADVEGWRERLATRIEQRTRALSSAVDAAGQMYAPEQLHQVRIAGKKLRYALELAADTGTRGAARHVRTLKRLQDLLGRLHDLQILAHHVVAVQADPAPGTAAGRHDMERLATHIERECRTEHARYVAAVAGVRNLCAAMEAEILPGLARPARPRRAIKMTLPKPAAHPAGSRR